MSPRSSKRGNQLERCYQLAAHLLEGKPLNRKTVAALLNVGHANADRHLRAIQKTMKVSVKEKRGLKTLQAERQASVPLNRTSAAALCMAASLSRLFSTTSYAERMKEAVSRVLESAHTSLDFSNYDRQFFFLTRGGEKALLRKNSKLLDTIVDAIVEQKKLRVRHQRFDGDIVEVRISPLSLTLHEHQLYLIGQASHQLENIRFSRILRALKMKEGFEYPPTEAYSPTKVFHDSLGIFIRDEPESGISVRKVTLRLKKSWIPYVRSHRWHHSQRHYKDGDGVIVELRLRTCRELDRLILGFGPDAEVLAPADLRERIAKRARGLSEVYTSK